MSCKTHRTVSIPVNDLHRTWYLLHFLTSNLYTQWVYKKNLLLSKDLKEFYWETIFLIYKGEERDAEN